MKQDIGIAEIHYNRDGQAIAAFFVPTVHQVDPKAVEGLLMQTTPKTPEQAKEQAGMVLADWFVAVGETETADREEYRIESEMVECLKHDNGLPQLCKIEFFLVKIH